VPYEIIVCVKQVPDTANITAEAMKEDGTVNRGALPAIFNPEDLHALETAIEIKDRFGGTVTAITMGPPKASEVLRDCLYRGADRGILLTDRRAAASDTLATSYILSQAVKAVGNYDIVLCGRQAIDGDTAQVGPQIAEKLDVPQITYLESVEALEDKTITVRRATGSGWEILESSLPLLITVIDTANTPRPPAMRRVMKLKLAQTPAEIASELRGQVADDQLEAEVAKRAEELKAKGRLIEQWDLDDIKADIDRCGLSGSPTKVSRIQSIVLTKEGYSEVEPTEEGITKLVHELITDRTIG